MSIGTAMLSAFILLCAVCLIVGILYGLVNALVDRPVVLGTIIFGLLWAFATWALTFRR